MDSVASAALRSGRSPEDITLVAASKMNDAGRVREAFDAGIRVFGENRVQEMCEKLSLDAYDGAELHFIGHLQKNKVRKVVGFASLIHSADSVPLLEEISRVAVSGGLTQDVLLEINIAGEESKSGFSPEMLDSALISASALPGIRVRGLMCVPPICEQPENNEPFFVAMRQLFIDNSSKKYDNVSMDFLSMGMSGDYETAIACGANMVRIGSALFGPRNYAKSGGPV